MHTTIASYISSEVAIAIMYKSVCKPIYSYNLMQPYKCIDTVAIASYIIYYCMCVTVRALFYKFMFTLGSFHDGMQVDGSLPLATYPLASYTHFSIAQSF